MKSRKERIKKKNYIRRENFYNDRNKCTIIAFMIRKGGAIKTTGSLSFATYLCRKGKKVLLIDTDEQCDLTKRLYKTMERYPNSIGDFLDGDKIFDKKLDIFGSLLGIKLKRLARLKENKGKAGKICLIPGSPYLLNDVTAVINNIESNKYPEFDNLKDIIEFILEKFKIYFDFIIFDTPPSMEINPLNKVLCASVDVIVHPVSNISACSGLKSNFEFVRKSGENPREIIIIGKYQKMVSKLKGGKDKPDILLDALFETFGDYICKTVVPEKKSLKQKIPCMTKDEYVDLSRELLEKINNPNEKTLQEYLGENEKLLNSFEATVQQILENERNKEVETYIARLIEKNQINH